MAIAVADSRCSFPFGLSTRFFSLIRGMLIPTPRHSGRSVAMITKKHTYLLLALSDIDFGFTQVAAERSELLRFFKREIAFLCHMT